jgi:hypothetical protein
MKTKTTNSGLKVKANVKAGGFWMNGANHNHSGLKVRAGVKAGAFICQKNHNARLLAV